MRRTLVALACVIALLAGAGPAHAAPPAATPTSTVGGYTPPPFADGCTVHRFGEGEWPPLWLWFTDPLCVEYAKRDITADNGGALRFLLAARTASSVTSSPK